MIKLFHKYTTGHYTLIIGLVFTVLTIIGFKNDTTNIVYVGASMLVAGCAYWQYFATKGQGENTAFIMFVSLTMWVASCVISLFMPIIQLLIPIILIYAVYKLCTSATIRNYWK